MCPQGPAGCPVSLPWIDGKILSECQFEHPKPRIDPRGELNLPLASPPGEGHAGIDWRFYYHQMRNGLGRGPGNPTP